jgi:hypothetical protein
MIPEGIRQTSIPNPNIYFGKGKNNFKRPSFYESPVLLKFYSSIWKYVVPYADS